MALTVRPRVYGHAFLECAWVTVSPTRSTRSPANSRRSRRLCTGHSVPSATRRDTVHANGRAYGCVRSVNVAPLHRPRDARSRGAPVGSGYGAGSREEGGLVYGPCRPPEARDEHVARSSASRHRAETVRHARVTSPRGQPTGVAHQA